MLSNLSGWHAVILLVVLLLMVAAIVAVVLIVLAAARRSKSSSAGDIGAKLKALDRLRDEGSLSDAEYQAKRAEILARL